jgi:hypothetical protein
MASTRTRISRKQRRKLSTLFDEDRSTMPKNATTVSVTFPERSDSLIIQGGWL